MACTDAAQLEADIATLEQQIRDLRAAMVSQAISTASGTASFTGGREFNLQGPKGGKIDFKEGSSGNAGGASAMSSARLLEILKNQLKCLKRDLRRCRQGNRVLAPKLIGIDTGGSGCGC